MSVNPVDSEIFGPLWGTDEMRALFSDTTRLQLMLDVEAALARAEARLGIVPQPVAEAITAAARVGNLRMERIAEGTRKAGEREAGYIHLGATTQDILDTATVLQMRGAFANLRRDLIRLAGALAEK